MITREITESAREFLSTLVENKRYLDDKIDRLEKLIESLNNKILQISRILGIPKSVISFPDYNDEFFSDYAEMIRALIELADIKVKIVSKGDEYDEAIHEKVSEKIAEDYTQYNTITDINKRLVYFLNGKISKRIPVTVCNKMPFIDGESKEKSHLFDINQKSDTDGKFVFGIDLGVTNSVISYIDEDLLVQTCINEYGDMFTPSVVDLSDVYPIVGQVAKDNQLFYPHSVLDFFKREMGNGHATIYYGENFDNETTAIDLSAEVLKYLAKYASDATGSIVDRVAITVPVYFGIEEKLSTKEAAEKVGFKEIIFIEEPIAAVINYGYTGNEKETVLVYNHGGSTFDVTAVEINHNDYSILYADGDFLLGGKDWDARMQDIIKEKLTEDGVDISNLDDENTAEIQVAAEKAKKVLTDKEAATIKLRLECGKYKFEVTRAEFEERTKDLLDRTIKITRNVKEKIEEKGREISKIILVGGSSYMPQVQQRLISEFSDLEIPNPGAPNLALSRGAAYYAYRAFGMKQKLEGLPCALYGCPTSKDRPGNVPSCMLTTFDGFVLSKV